MADITKGKIGEQDLYKYDGSGTDTFSRTTSSGASLTLTKVGYEVDVLMSYGDGVTFTKASIDSALTAIGTSNSTIVLLRPGTWVVDADADYSSYTNITWKIPAGADLEVATGKTLTLAGSIEAGDYQIFSGAGTVTGLKNTTPYWFGGVADGTDMTTICDTALKATVAGGILTIPNGMMWNYDTIKADHPDDVLIIDYSGYDWQNSIANSAQVRYITNTSSPSTKNAHNYVYMADYHPAVVVENTAPHNYGIAEMTPMSSFIYRDTDPQGRLGRSRWQLLSQYYNDNPLWAIKIFYVYRPWLTATSYALFDLIQGPDDEYYICDTAHTSGVFATDLAAGYWSLYTGKSFESAFSISGKIGTPITAGGTPSDGVKFKVQDVVDRELKVYLRAYTGNDTRIVFQDSATTKWSMLSTTATNTFSLMAASGAYFSFENDGELKASDGTNIHGYKNLATATYDFATSGGAVSTISLDQGIPDNAVITRAWYEVLTPPTSSGAATIALGVATNDADGIKTATAYNDASFNAGFHDGTPDGTATNFTTKTTASRKIVLVIAGANLTAGKIKVYAEFIVSE